MYRDAIGKFTHSQSAGGERVKNTYRGDGAQGDREDSGQIALYRYSMPKACGRHDESMVSTSTTT